MGRTASSKLLIPWIEGQCNDGFYIDLIRWIDKKKKIFFVSWIHKSSANWTESKSDVFKAWARYKGILGIKDDRDLKALFRNAFRSKKNCLKQIEKSKEHMCWQILSEPIKTPKRVTTNKEKKTRQKKGTKKVNKKCQPVETENYFQEPPSSPSCSSVFSHDGIGFPSSPLQSLPPCQTLLHSSPPSTPSQQTDVIFADIEDQPDLASLFRSLNIPTTGNPMRELVTETPLLNSSPPSPAQSSVSESLYDIPSLYGDCSPQSPAQRLIDAFSSPKRSTDELYYKISSPNIEPRLQSPVQMFTDEAFHGISSPNTEFSPTQIGDEAQYSHRKSPINIPNELIGSMSPEQEVPALNIVDLLNAVPEMETETQEFLNQMFSSDFYHQVKDECVSFPNGFETLLEIKPAQQALFSSSNEYFSTVMNFNC